MSHTTARPLTNPAYRLGGSFAIVTAMDVRRWWGLRGRKQIGLPPIPRDAFEGEAVVGTPGAMIQTAIVSVAFLTSDDGRRFVDRYLEALPTFLAAHDVTIDHDLMIDCLAWSLTVTITDPSAPDGTRHLETYELLGLAQFERTVAALRAPRASDAPPLVLTSEDMADDSAYLPLGDLMAVDAASVTLEFAEEADDEDGSGDELRFDRHRVTLDRAPFATAMADVLRSLQGLTDAVCGALGVRYNTIVREAARVRRARD